jgi:YebC/PmpR family DNA-binding regulatory protein
MGRAHEVRAASMAKTALMKSKKYSKWGKEILDCAKAGDPNPDMNQPLKKLIERAKKDQCPAEVIKIALEKASGLKSGNMKETHYEGYGPGKAAVMVDCLTDNVNRTFTDVRQIFSKTGGTIGTTVGHLFARRAKFVFSGMTEDETLEVLMGADVFPEETSTDENGNVVILDDPKNASAISDALEASGKELDFKEQGVSMIASMYVDLDEEAKAKFDRMMEMFAENEDVQDVTHNANVAEEDDEE